MRKIQQLTIDGVDVDVSKARFADTFEVAERDERLLAFDEEVVYVVVARVSTPSFRETKKGELSRVNVLKVKEARLLKKEELKVAILDSIGFDYRPQPSLFDEEEEVKESTDPLDGVRLLEEEEVPNLPPTEEEFLESLEARLEDVDGGWGDEDEARTASIETIGLLAETFGNEPIDPEVVVEGGRRRIKVPSTADSDPMLKRFLGEVL